MKADIVLPKGNEAELVEMASRLGFEGLVLAYPAERLRGIQLPKVKSGLKLALGCLLDPKCFKAQKGALTLLSGCDRHGFEKIKPNIAFGLEYSNKMDKPHYRVSGLDDVCSRLAAKNGIIVGFSFSGLLHPALPKAVVLGRTMQNIRFCRKFGVEMLLASFASNPYDMRASEDLRSIGASLGMSIPEAKAAVECLGGFF